MSNQNNKESQSFTQSDMAKAVSDAIKESLPMATAVAAKTMAEVLRPPSAVIPQTAQGTPIHDARETCGACRQRLVACKNNHRKLVVFPKDTQYARFFTGVKINGINYLSSHPGHFIEVPAESNIEYVVEQFEENERIQAHGRQKNHNSGSMGTHGSNINHANYPGFR